MGSEIIYVDGVRCERQYNNLATQIGKLVELFKNEKENKFAVRRSMRTIYVCNGMSEAYRLYNKFA